jgi:hypothetical protein
MEVKGFRWFFFFTLDDSTTPPLTGDKKMKPKKRVRGKRKRSGVQKGGANEVRMNQPPNAAW